MFKPGYMPKGLGVNVVPVFMYSNNAVVDTVLFSNTYYLSAFGGPMVANQNYYFQFVYFIE